MPRNTTSAKIPLSAYLSILLTTGISTTVTIGTILARVKQEYIQLLQRTSGFALNSSESCSSIEAAFCFSTNSSLLPENTTDILCSNYVRTDSHPNFIPNSAIYKDPAITLIAGYAIASLAFTVIPLLFFFAVKHQKIVWEHESTVGFLMMLLPVLFPLIVDLTPWTTPYAITSGCVDLCNWLGPASAEGGHENCSAYLMPLNPVEDPFRAPPCCADWNLGTRIVFNLGMIIVGGAFLIPLLLEKTATHIAIPLQHQVARLFMNEKGRREDTICLREHIEAKTTYTPL